MTAAELTSDGKIVRSKRGDRIGEHEGPADLYKEFVLFDEMRRHQKALSE